MYGKVAGEATETWKHHSGSYSNTKVDVLLIVRLLRQHVFTKLCVRIKVDKKGIGNKMGI